MTAGLGDPTRRSALVSALPPDLIVVLGLESTHPSEIATLVIADVRSILGPTVPTIDQPIDDGSVTGGPAIGAPTPDHPGDDQTTGNPHADGTTGNPHFDGTTGNPHADGTTGNPHFDGTTGNPHADGTTGNPHAETDTGSGNDPHATSKPSKPPADPHPGNGGRNPNAGTDDPGRTKTKS